MTKETKDDLPQAVVRTPISALKGKRVTHIEEVPGGQHLNGYYRFWVSKTKFFDVGVEHIFDHDGMYFKNDLG